MGQKRTKGYHGRLALALKEGPRPMSVRALAEAFGEGSPYHGLRGTSYGGIRQYVDGSVGAPRIEVLRAIADVLGVRGEWLAFGEGAMTETKEAAARHAREARVALGAETIERTREEREQRLRKAIVAEAPALERARSVTWSRIAALLESMIIADPGDELVHDTPGTGPRMLTREEAAERWKAWAKNEEDREVQVARRLARAISAPARATGSDLEDMSPTHLDLYVEAACHAVALLLVRAESIRQEDSDAEGP